MGWTKARGKNSRAGASQSSRAATASIDSRPSTAPSNADIAAGSDASRDAIAFSTSLAVAGTVRTKREKSRSRGRSGNNRRRSRGGRPSGAWTVPSQRRFQRPGMKRLLKGQHVVVEGEQLTRVRMLGAEARDPPATLRPDRVW